MNEEPEELEGQVRVSRNVEEHELENALHSLSKDAGAAPSTVRYGRPRYCSTEDCRPFVAASSTLGKTAS